MHPLRLAIVSGGIGTGELGLALGRLGGRRGGGVAVAVASPTSGGRGVCATRSAAAPDPGDQGVAMDQDKPPHPRADAPVPEQGGARRVDGGGAHKPTMAHGDVMSHSFGEGYATRSEEEGFGCIYGVDDESRPVLKPRTDDVHPSHPDYDISQGCEVKEKEKARHHKDDKHGT